MGNRTARTDPFAMSSEDLTAGVDALHKLRSLAKEESIYQPQQRREKPRLHAVLQCAGRARRSFNAAGTSILSQRIISESAFFYGFLGIEMADTSSHDVSRLLFSKRGFMERDELQTLRELCSRNTERRRSGGWRLVRRLGALIGVLRAIREHKGKPKRGS